MGKKKKDEGGGGDGLDPDAWMGTLSDLVFLLITFFVLLITMSSLDAKSVKKAFGFFDDATGVLNFPDETKGTDRFTEVLNPLAQFKASAKVTAIDQEEKKQGKPVKSTNDLLRALKTHLKEGEAVDKVLTTLHPLIAKTGGEAIIERRHDELSVVLAGRLIFNEKNGEIGQEGQEILSNVAEVLKLWGGDVEILAVWPWRKGPLVLAQITHIMEKQWLKGNRLHPKLYAGHSQTIRFVLKKRRDNDFISLKLPKNSRSA